MGWNSAAGFPLPEPGPPWERNRLLTSRIGPLVEVLSGSTAERDDSFKRWAYGTIPSLKPRGDPQRMSNRVGQDCGRIASVI